MAGRRGRSSRGEERETCVKEDIRQPQSKVHVRRRAARYRQGLAPDPVRPGVRFNGAYDWFRAAAAYANRRSYRTLDIGEAARARRNLLITDAARMLQEHACEMDALVLPLTAVGRQAARAKFRVAYSPARPRKDQLAAAHAWLLFIARQAERRGGEGAAQAAGIKDRAAARLIEWAEEMDSDNYGE